LAPRILVFYYSRMIDEVISVLENYRDRSQWIPKIGVHNVRLCIFLALENEIQSSMTSVLKLNYLVLPYILAACNGISLRVNASLRKIHNNAISNILHRNRRLLLLLDHTPIIIITTIDIVCCGSLLLRSFRKFSNRLMPYHRLRFIPQLPRQFLIILKSNPIAWSRSNRQEPIPRFLAHSLSPVTTPAQVPWVRVAGIRRHDDAGGGTGVIIGCRSLR